MILIVMAVIIMSARNVMRLKLGETILLRNTKMVKNHSHNYVPVDVLWLSLWASMSRSEKAKVGWVVLACKCGAVKTVRAYLETGKSLLVEHQRLTKA